MLKNIGIFCSSRLKPNKNYSMIISELVKWLKLNKFNLVIGGESTGLMHSLSKTAFEEKIRVFGIINYNFKHEVKKNKYITDLIITRTLEERKKQFIARSDCFIFLPGGLGTLNELLDLIVKREYEEVTKNIFLISDELWNPFFKYLNYLTEKNMIKKDSIKKNIIFLEPKNIRHMRSIEVKN